MKTTNQEPASWTVRLTVDSFNRQLAEAEATVRRKIASLRNQLDDAERQLNAASMPNTCGICQSAGLELDMAVARYHALRETADSIATLAKCANPS